jgi:hypothetical protein
MTKTFKDFIAEAKGSATIEEAIRFIRKECQPFLKKNKNWLLSGEGIFRGMNAAADAYTGTPRIDRKPKDTSMVMHKMLGNYFTRKFGYNYREGLFGSTDPSQARGYGDVFAIFPTGDDYRILWSEVADDLYNILSSSSDYEIEVPDMDLDVEQTYNYLRVLLKYHKEPTAKDQEFVDTILDGFDYEETQSLSHIEHMYESTGIELMIKCKSYIALKLDNQGGSVDAYKRYLEQIYAA